MSRDLLAATEAIYSRLEAGWDWTPVVVELARVVGARSGCVVIGDSADGEPTVGCFHNIDPEWVRAYDAHYHRYDPTFEILSASPGTVRVDHITGNRPRELEGAPRRFYDEYMRPQGFRHTLALGLPGIAGLEAALIFKRTAADGGFDERAVRALDRIGAHIQRSLKLQVRLDGAGAAQKGFRHAIEQAPLGVLLLNARGRPVFVNTRAESILAEAPQLTLGDTGLESPNAARVRKLNELIHGAALAARGAAGYQGGILFVDGSGDGRGLKIRVDPLCTKAHEDKVMTPGARVIVWITPLRTGDSPCSRQLRDTYELTAAEAELLAGLVSGHRLPDIADARRVSRETVRTQLKGLMAKFGVNRQADLVRAVLQGTCTDGTESE